MATNKRFFRQKIVLFLKKKLGNKINNKDVEMY